MALAPGCLCLYTSIVRPSDTAQTSTGEVVLSPPEAPAWRGRAAMSPLPSGCAECDEFASEVGFFSVAADCVNRTGFLQLQARYFRDEQWVSTQLSGCLAGLISSLGTSRPSSFFRQGLPAATYLGMPGVIVGRRTRANVTGTYAFDADSWLASRGGQLHERPLCLNESAHAVDRLRFTNKLCGSMDLGDLHTALRKSSLNCRFSSLEAMAQQHAAFNLASECDRDLYHNQVSLRYGIDDVTGVIFNSPEHEAVARDFALWLRQLTRRDISLVRTTPGVGAVCECKTLPSAAVESIPHPLRLPALGVAAVASAGEEFCAEHWCDGKEATRPCCPTLPASPEIHPSLNQHPKYHPMFLHIPKTGGSSIECLTKDWDATGLWTNMGHASSAAVSRCAKHAQTHAQPALIITVRNPYDHWLSVYEYAKVCLGRSSHRSATANFLKKTNGTASLASFASFLKHMRSQPSARAVAAQTHHVVRICGNPCQYHFLLRTETLDADWLALLGQLRLPLKPLPHVNVVDGSARRTHQLAAHYTPELARIVQEMELLLFDHFGYSRDL